MTKFYRKKISISMCKQRKTFLKLRKCRKYAQIMNINYIIRHLTNNQTNLF